MDVREKLVQLLKDIMPLSTFEEQVDHLIDNGVTVREAAERLRDIDARPSAHFVHDGPRFSGGVDWWHCSSCGRLASGVETRFDYCPWCGARMDGDSNAKAD